MALVKCENCGKEISDKAVNCPHCSFPCKRKFGLFIPILLGIVVILGFCFVYFLA